MKGVKVDPETLKRIKTEAPQIYSKQIIGKQALAKMFGIDRVTLWRLEKSDSVFNKAMIEASVAQNLLRDEGVEDVFTNRLLKGEGSAAEYIFYLCNRMSHRWKNSHHLQYSGNVDINVGHMIQTLAKAELMDKNKRLEKPND